jgi:nucleotide-binding universal stress UspA family protein
VSVTYERIACFIDDSDAASRALAHASALRDAAGAKLSVVHVLAPPAFLVSLAAGLGGAAVHDPEVEREAAEMWLAEEARSVGAEAVLLEGHPASTAVEWARKEGADVLVVATHRGLVERALLGSFAGYVAHHAPCPVFLIPPEQDAS